MEKGELTSDINGTLPRILTAEKWERFFLQYEGIEAS
jgi:hypothetical protein